MKQELRNKIYGVAAAVGTILATIGYLSVAESEQALSFVDRGLDIVSLAILLGGNVLAFIKSRPSKVTTIELPVADVRTVKTVEGEILTVDEANSKPVA